jgi:hypothetical protein
VKLRVVGSRGKFIESNSCPDGESMDLRLKGLSLILESAYWFIGHSKLSKRSLTSTRCTTVRTYLCTHRWCACPQHTRSTTNWYVPCSWSIACWDPSPSTRIGSWARPSRGLPVPITDTCCPSGPELVTTNANSLRSTRLSPLRIAKIIYFEGSLFALDALTPGSSFRSWVYPI